MVILRFAMENLRRKPKDAYFFAFTMFAASAVITLFFTIINNPIYGNNERLFANQSEMGMVAAFDGGVGTGLFSMMLCFLMIFICILSVFFANKFFLISKLKDIGIMSASGCNLVKTAKFLIYQNMMVTFISAPIGAIVGFLAHPVLNFLIYQQMQIEAPLISLNLSSIGLCLFTFGMICFWLILSNVGFVYRTNSLTELFQARQNMNPIGKQKNTFLKLTYLALYVFTLYFLTTLHASTIHFIFMIYVGAAVYLGGANTFRYGFPEILTYCKEHYFYAHKHKKIALCNLRYSVINGNLLVTIILLAISTIFFFLGKFRHDPATFMIVFIAYLVVMLLICICIGYKLCVDALAKRNVFRNLLAIGYLKSDIKHIIRQECIGFFALIDIISLPLLLVICFIFLNETITFTFMSIILGIFIGMLAVTGWCIYHIYCHLIISDQLTIQQREE